MQEDLAMAQAARAQEDMTAEAQADLAQKELAVESQADLTQEELPLKAQVTVDLVVANNVHASTPNIHQIFIHNTRLRRLRRSKISQWRLR